MMVRNNNSVNKRLIKSVLLISVFIAVIITAFETYTTYQNNFSQLEKVDEQVREVLLPVLVDNVWQLDRDDIISQMSLILSQPVIEMVQLKVEQGETFKVGEVKSDETKIFKYKLIHEHNNKQLQIGTLFVNAGLDYFYEQAKTQVIINFAGNSTIVFMVSFLVVFLTRHYITRHLVDLSNNLLGSQFQGNQNKALTLNRKRSISTIGDELDNVVNAINDMRTNILSSHKKTRESQERLTQIADNSLMWIWEVDKDGLYTYCSDTCEYILGYSAKEIVGKKYFYDFFHPEDRSELTQAAFNVFDKQDNFKEFENRNINRIGDTVWLSTSGVPVLDKDRRSLGYRGADIDITARKKLMEEQSRAAQLAVLGTVAAGVAHEINNPINGIINYAALLEKYSDEPTRVEDLAKRITKESNRIANITSDLLHYSKDSRTDKRAIDIIEVIQSALSLISTKIRHTGILVKTEFDKDLPQFLANPQSIQQVIINLVDNAYDAIRFKKEQSEDPVINIRCYLVKNGSQMCCIEVYDNGGGMSEDVFKKAKDAFYTTKPSSEGTGLGLSIVHDIVTKHKGHFNIESHEGEYTKVQILLPLEGDVP